MKIPQKLTRSPSRLKPKIVEGIFVVSLALIVFLLPIASGQYGDFHDLAGDYCRARTGNNCCDGRIDSCSLPILGTLCYCDQFCNRTGNPDCCPDYWNVCLGLNPIPPPPPFTVKSCYVDGIEIPHLGTTTVNCNKCKCKHGDLDCEKDPCLINEELLRHIQDGYRTIGWSASNYSQFWGKKLDDGLMMLTGTLAPDEKSLRMHPIKLHYDLEQLPRSFDAREKWNHLSTIRDQGWCGASWAFSTIAVTEDRLTIASDETEVVQLSTQNLLSCNRRGQQACNGGHVERAWNYLRKIGVVTEDCYPYISGLNGISEPCKIQRHSTLQNVDCERKEFPLGRTELYTTEPAYRIASKEGDIMWELLTNGPVQALMRVYQDFFVYKEGVYSRTNINSNGKFSVHSVKILGWGEESSYAGPIKYWLAANSWGENWGLGGTFKIQRGTNESDIEQFILAVRTHLATEAKMVNRRRNRLTNQRRHRRQR